MRSWIFAVASLELRARDILVDVRSRSSSRPISTTPPPFRAGRSRRGRGMLPPIGGAPATFEVDLGHLRSPRGSRRGAHRRRRRRSARASRREAVHGAAARDGAARDGSRRTLLPLRELAPLRLLRRVGLLLRAVSFFSGVAAPAVVEPGFFRRARHGCRGGASAWSGGRIRFGRVGGRVGQLLLGLSLARVRRTLSRRKTPLPGYGSQGESAFLVEARGCEPGWGARALVVDERAWHGLRIAGSNRPLRVSVQAPDLRSGQLRPGGERWWRSTRQRSSCSSKRPMPGSSTSR